MTPERLYEIMMDAALAHREASSVPSYLIEELVNVALGAGVKCGGLVVTCQRSESAETIDYNEGDDDVVTCQRSEPNPEISSEIASESTDKDLEWRANQARWEM